MPIPEFAASAASLGHAEMALDDDGVARKAYLRAGLGSPHWPALALALLQLDQPAGAGTELPGRRLVTTGLEPVSLYEWVRDHEVLVPFTSPPNAFRHVSYTDVLNQRIPASLLRGNSVSYTHLTLPTICSVQISVVAGCFKQEETELQIQARQMHMTRS
eukprot:TRINITY_DN15656_c0_g1_i2.p4 TRINITY_DN15656_c0_g1~~TRINITY_DN15656_c0_g1_i2.p4  ORF type:complete len:160 (+),score=9.83 TRINITY_DN15656_c0_g1_i2:1187-1666(+)